MVEKNQTTKNAHDSDSGQGNRNLGHFRGVLIGGAWAFIGLLLVSLFWPNLSERTKFFTGNLWNLVIAFAVIAQVRINHWQWQIMREQKRIATIGERAYLGIKNVKIDNPIMNNTIVVHALIFNGGRTPALNIQRRFQIGLVDEKESRSFEWGGDIKTDLTVLPAGAERWLTLPDVPISQTAFQEFGAGKRMIHVAGQFRFTDFVGMKQVFEFDMTCEFSDNGSFKETYQRQYEDPAQDITQPS
jgi:hypothetical protein